MKQFKKKASQKMKKRQLPHQTELGKNCKMNTIHQTLQSDLNTQLGHIEYPKLYAQIVQQRKYGKFRTFFFSISSFCVQIVN